MSVDYTIQKINPDTEAAMQMSEALWEEIQERYGFKSANLVIPAMFNSETAGFWVAFNNNNTPIGSIAIFPLTNKIAEIDVMYVVPSLRRKGLATQLLHKLEQHARSKGIRLLRLRAGNPQPEAMCFYKKMGFYPIDRFGRWVNDTTAQCLEKEISSPSIHYDLYPIYLLVEFYSFLWHNFRQL